WAADAVGLVGEAAPGGQEAAHDHADVDVPRVLVLEALQHRLQRPAVRADGVGDVVDVDLAGRRHGLERLAGGAGVGGAADPRLDVAHHGAGQVDVAVFVHCVGPPPPGRALSASGSPAL